MRNPKPDLEVQHCRTAARRDQGADATVDLQTWAPHCTQRQRALSCAAQSWLADPAPVAQATQEHVLSHDAPLQPKSRMTSAIDGDWPRLQYLLIAQAHRHTARTASSALLACAFRPTHPPFPSPGRLGDRQGACRHAADGGSSMTFHGMEPHTWTICGARAAAR